jgi:hypothetical protein
MSYRLTCQITFTFQTFNFHLYRSILGIPINFALRARKKMIVIPKIVYECKIK